jgi:hypothetical protein
MRIIALLLCIAFSIAGSSAQTTTAVRIDADDIGGIVTSTMGPEAGVWGIPTPSPAPPFAWRPVPTRR